MKCGAAICTERVGDIVVNKKQTTDAVEINNK